MSSIPKRNMVGFVCVSIYCVLSRIAVPVAGQCMASSCAFSPSGFEECPGELDHMLETMNQSIYSALVKLEAAVKRTNEQEQNLFSTFQTVNRSLDEKLQTMNETFSSAIDKISEKLNAILDLVNENLQYSRSQDLCRNTSTVCDCSDIKAHGCTANGVYPIYVVDQGQRYYANAFCDMTTTNGAWTVFQRRKDGSVGFYRRWNDYENGFGNPNGEFWLGNNFLRLLTSKRRFRLRIDLEDFEGGKRYAEYSTFNITSSADKYRLRIGTYTGNAGGDGLSHSNGQQFTTEDNDNDGKLNMNCAVNSRGPWWHHDCDNVCGYSNLNGLYLRGNYSSNGSLNGMEGIYWDGWRGKWYALKTTEMKISS